MISLNNLFEDIQQPIPPQQPGQPVQQPVQQPQNVQKPGLWNKIKSGYDSLNQKYEKAGEAVNDALLSNTARGFVPMVGGLIGNALLPGYGYMLGSMTSGMVHGAMSQAHQMEKMRRMQQQQMNQQPVVK